LWWNRNTKEQRLSRVCCVSAWLRNWEEAIHSAVVNYRWGHLSILFVFLEKIWCQKSNFHILKRVSYKVVRSMWFHLIWEIRELLLKRMLKRECLWHLSSKIHIPQKWYVEKIIYVEKVIMLDLFYKDGVCTYQNLVKYKSHPSLFNLIGIGQHW